MIFFDVETRGTADLTAVGGRIYAEHPHTQILCLGIWNDGYEVWVPPSIYRGELDDAALRPAGYSGGVKVHRDDDFPFRSLPGPWCAHNATGFDAHILRAICRFEPEIYDTLPAARAAGLPGDLDSIGKVLFGEGKDAGQRFLGRLSFGTVADGEPRYRPVWQGYLTEVIRYCLADVGLVKRLYESVAGREEAAVVAVHNRINDRGIAFDRRLAATLCRLSSEVAARAAAEIERLTGGKLRNPRSQPQTLAWVNSQGIFLHHPEKGRQSLERNLVERFIAEPEEFISSADEAGTRVEVPPAVIRVLKLRQAATRQLASKLEAALASVSPDGRLRDLLVYHAAHTGRWSSRRVQIHNLAKGLAPPPGDRAIFADLLSLYETRGLTLTDILDCMHRYRAAGGAATEDDILTTLIRPCFIGRDLWISDYASIEARGLAWWAGQEDLLRQFRDRIDVYCDAAAELVGRPVSKDDDVRRIGKTVILGCGYGMGPTRFQALCDAQRIDLQAAGLTAEQCIGTYRSRYAAIPRLWQEAGRAVMSAVRGEPTEVNGVEWFMDGRDLVCRLPSGRRLMYRNASIQPVVPGYCRVLHLPEVPKPTVCYDSPRGYSDCLFGGKIVENVVQGICRDLLADAICRLPDVVFHVHDEIVCETQAWEGLAKKMVELPRWAEGLPLEIEWHVASRYFKGGLGGPSGRKAAYE